MADLVPGEVRAVMRRLEELDARDREDGTPRERRLRAIHPDVGQFLLTFAVATTARLIVEVGTSGGYSTLWLGVAAKHNRGRVITFEIDPGKAAIARQTIGDAGLADWTVLRHQDAFEGLGEFRETADLLFLDAEKEDYSRFLGPAVAALRPGGCLIADNLLSHEEDLEAFRLSALSHPALSGLVVPVGRGELVAVKTSEAKDLERGLSSSSASRSSRRLPSD